MVDETSTGAARRGQEVEVSVVYAICLFSVRDGDVAKSHWRCAPSNHLEGCAAQKCYQCVYCNYSLFCKRAAELLTAAVVLNKLLFSYVIYPNHASLMLTLLRALQEAQGGICKYS